MPHYAYDVQRYIEENTEFSFEMKKINKVVATMDSRYWQDNEVQGATTWVNPWGQIYTGCDETQGYTENLPHAYLFPMLLYIFTSHKYFQLTILNNTGHSRSIKPI